MLRKGERTQSTDRKTEADFEIEELGMLRAQALSLILCIGWEKKNTNNKKLKREERDEHPGHQAHRDDPKTQT